MTKDVLRDIIFNCCNDITFSYKGKQSGVTSEVHNYIPTFQSWHGNSTKKYTDINDVMEDAFFSGKSLNDLADKIKFTVI